MSMAAESSSKQSLIQAITARVPSVRDGNGFILTAPFLDTCRMVLPVVDKLGAAFKLVEYDISGNIQRLESKIPQDAERYQRLFTIVQDEVVAGTHNDSSSCTKGLLWLKRAMEFITAVMQRMLTEPLHKAVADVYRETLMQYHGFMVSSAFTLAFKFVPTREQFVASLDTSEHDNLDQQVKDFVEAFGPLLKEIHGFMVENNLDDPTKV
uniref:Glycolipid transfer protein domain-containing protein n=2 Tax=Dunaliella tertiolecta TaxID=3047 RepID=A0A7S3QL51_DUNTE